MFTHAVMAVLGAALATGLLLVFYNPTSGGSGISLPGSGAVPAPGSASAPLAAGALAAATRSLALEYASRGIRVNAVCPGVIQAPLDPAGGFGGPAGWLPPLGRAGQVSDVVDGVLFLKPAGYITGEILHVDGGHSAGCGGPLD